MIDENLLKNLTAEQKALVRALDARIQDMKFAEEILNDPKAASQVAQQVDQIEN